MEKCNIWQDYENAEKYKNSILLNETIIKSVDFYEGRQWGEPTERTKYLPRPVFNIIKMICRNKKSAILSSPIKLIFNNYKANNLSQDLTRFVEHLQKELKQKDLDNRAIKDGVIKGTYIYHYYYDAEAQGVTSNYEGGVRGEIIDTLSFFVENPQETDEQKQKWIIISSRLPVATVKQIADNDKKDIVSADDAEQNFITEQKQDGTETCTVLTKYYRENGEVHVIKAVKGGVICDKKPLAPELIRTEKTQNNTEEDAGESELPDKEQTQKGVRVAASLYPIVVGNYEDREKCIFGIGEVESIIPNQIAINFNYAMQILAVQNSAWSKYIVKPNALNGQKITNEPGQVLVDHSGGNGIQAVAGATINQQAISLADNIIDATRSVTGSTEVLTGDNVTNMSGVAIAQLQSQALKPIEELRARFWRVREKCGAVIAQFVKTHYHDKYYSYRDDENLKNVGNQGKDQEQQMQIFNGSEIENDEFEVVAEAGAGSQFSETLIMTTLNDLLKAQIIDPKTYISLYPDSAMPNKQDILDFVNQKEQGQVSQLTAQTQQMQAQLQQAMQQLQGQQKVILNASSIVNENRKLNEQLIALQAEYTAKINQANAGLQQTEQRAKNNAGLAGYMARQADNANEKLKGNDKKAN